MTIANFCDAHYFKIYGVSKKTFKKLYMFYFETFQIILNPSSVGLFLIHLWRLF